MAKYQIGEKIKFHSNFDYETNCAICAKPLGKSSNVILIGDGDVLISSTEYQETFLNGGFVYSAPIGSSCVKDFSVEVVA